MYHLLQPHHHVARIRHWAMARGAKAQIAGDTFALSVSMADRQIDLLPRFSIRTAQGLAYTHHYADDGAFVGWTPYGAKRWPLSSDKLAFKEVFAKQGLRLPALLDPADLRGRDYLIKSRRGSFGLQVRGPFRASAAEQPVEALAEGEYCEQFIFGRAAKVWFWNDVPAAVEIVDPPHLRGDGRRTIAEHLGTPRGSFDKAFTADAAQQMLAWQGMTPHTIPEAGRKVWLGFKYVTPYDRLVLTDRDSLAKCSDALRTQIAAAGRVAFEAIPTDVRRGTLFTLDAVVDADDRAWWLEMNSHPMVHPQAYATMLCDCFGVS